MMIVIKVWAVLIFVALVGWVAEICEDLSRHLDEYEDD